jgi:hypothetical protein
MILHPAVLALLIGSLLTSFILLYATVPAARILMKWDLRSGSELQLSLERRTYLVATILTYAFTFQIGSLFLYIYTADNLHPLFTGAMCAAGTLHVNDYGYPVLLLKVATLLLAGVWLILNHADTRGYDYPLIKVKYALLLFLVPCVVLETVLQFLYFTNLHADVITSCCGSLFSLERPGITADIVGLPVRPTMLIFFGSIAATLVCGLYYMLKGEGGYIFCLTGSLAFPVGIAALISFICLYFYELPTHHCPFCILQKEYGYVGYLLYVALFGGGVAAMGVGVLMPFRKRGSMVPVIPPLQRRLVGMSLALYLLFTLIISWRLFFSAFTLGR